MGVNGKGQVVGIDVDGVTFVVATDGTRTTLPTTDPDTMATGISIDDAGRVAGYVTGANGRNAAVFQMGAWSPIPGLGGGSEPVLSTADGAIGGASYTTTGALRGFLLRDGQQVDFNWPEGGSAVYAATSGGVIAGIVGAADGATHAFRSVGKVLTDLGTLGGEKSAALGVNDRGDVVGKAELASGAAHPFIVPADATALIDLGLPPGALSGGAVGIDAAGNIVVNSKAADDSMHAWLFRVGKPPVELVAADADGTPYQAVRISTISTDSRAVGWGATQESAAGMSVHCLAWSVAGL